MEGAEDLQAMGTLIEERMNEWEQNWLRQGEAQLLHRLLNKRFGVLPDWAEAQLREASPAQLERWAEGLLDAQNLKSLLDGEET